MTRQIDIAALLGAALGLALVSPALAATKPVISTLRVPTSSANQQIITHTVFFNCSAVAGVPVAVAARCGPQTVTTGGGSTAASFKSDSLNVDRTDRLGCASVVGPRTTAVPLCFPRSTFGGGASIQPFDKNYVKITPPIIIVRCAARSTLPSPVAPWCIPQNTNNGSGARRFYHPVSTIGRHWDPPQFGFSLQFGHAVPQLSGTINQ
jgi:hypothetical protein